MANEKRLIDANALVEKILSLTLTVIGLRAGKGVLLELLNKYREGILQVVNEQPTVEAVEVVHGHKVVQERNRGIAYAMECPICNSRIPSNKPYAEKVEYCSVCGMKLDDTFQNYCPNCGAKMDGDGNG